MRYFGGDIFCERYYGRDIFRKRYFGRDKIYAKNAFNMMELAELFTRKIFHKLSLLKYKFGYPQDLCPSDITVLLPVAADEIIYSWDMKDVRYDMICSTSITQPIPYTVCV